MKKITKTLVTVLFVVLLFSFGTANAQTVNFDPNDATKATSVTGLIVNVDGTAVTYDVTFDVGATAFAQTVYGDFPGVYTFSLTEATDAATALNAALVSAGAEKIGEDGSIVAWGTYYIGYEGALGGSLGTTEYCLWTGGTGAGGSEWFDTIGTNFYNGEPGQWAIFTENNLGIDDETFGAAISVYPNPADNYINIKSKVFIQSVYMYDITGKVMKRLPFEVGESSATLDVSVFSSGMYFLRLEDDKGRVSVKKILIQ